MITSKRFIEIMNDNSIKKDDLHDNCFKGLKIIRDILDRNEKTKSDEVVIGAEHDIVISVYVNDILSEVTEEDVIKLKKLNWMIEDNNLACFV